MSEKIFYITTMMQVVGLLAYFFLTGCAPSRFPIGNGLSAEVIKIEPNRGPKSVYKIERYI